MKIEYNKQCRALIVHMGTEIDHHRASQMRTQIDDEFMRTRAEHIVFDFSDLQFMDSSGIGLIIGRYRLTHPLSGKIVLAGVSEQMDRIISLSGVYKLTEWAKDTDEALARI